MDTKRHEMGRGGEKTQNCMAWRCFTQESVIYLRMGWWIPVSYDQLCILRYTI